MAPLSLRLPPTLQTMNKILPYVISSGCIVASSVFIYNSSSTAQPPTNKGILTEHPQAVTIPSILTTQPASSDSLHAKLGHLWEKSPDPSVNQLTRVIIKKEKLEEIQQLPLDHEFSLALSPHLPTLEGVISHSSIQDDGTTLTQITIAGDPVGTLTLQENSEYNFFEGHLTYQDHPVAYRLTERNNAIEIAQISIEGIICSQSDNVAISVDHGLPVFGSVVKARGGNSGNKGNKSPRLSVGNASLVEGDSGSGNMIFQLSLSKESTSDVSASFATSNNSAEAGSDYTAHSGNLTFSPGQTSKEVTVQITGDLEVESDETFSLNLTNVSGADVGDATGVGTILDDDTPPPVSPGSVPIHNSRPSSTAVAYLDMDGQSVRNTSWNTGKNRKGINVIGVNNDYSQSSMTAIWTRVAEDFSPFDINVTTEESVYLEAPSNRRIRCIITPDWQWFGQAGGVAYLDSFKWTGDTPCWVFSSLLADSPKYIADASSHEIGHTLALLHDGRTTPSESYYEGHGSGPTSWAPIMGVGYYKNLVHWSKGEYANSNNKEDDLAIIVGNNGFPYRADDHNNNSSSATALTTGIASGVIEQRSDIDVFSFNLSAAGGITVRATGTTPDNNLDISLLLTDSSGSPIATINPEDGIDAKITVTLNAGTYFAHVSGAGKSPVNGSGYSDYGSLGEYQISVTLP